MYIEAMLAKFNLTNVEVSNYLNMQIVHVSFSGN